MSIWERLFGSTAQVPLPSPRASLPSGVTLIETSSQMEEALRTGNVTAAGTVVSPRTAMLNAAVYRCIALRAGIVATMPMQIKRRGADKLRADASDAPMWQVLNKRPNRWQKPAAFKRMLHSHVLLHGNGYAMKVRNARGQVVELIPLHPERVETKQLPDLSVVHVWRRADGRVLPLDNSEVMHLYVLTLDGVRGVTPLTFARESVGEALAMSRHGATVYKNGTNVASALKTPNKLSVEAYERLKSGMADFKAGGTSEGETIILEEGLSFDKLGMSMVDAEWINSRNFSRTDIAMFFGVPPHLIGHTEGNTQLGSSIEDQTQGFLSFSLEDDLAMWEEGVDIDCLDAPADRDLYMRMNRNALVRSDFVTRTKGYTAALQWGWLNPDEVRDLEDMNPREDGEGGKYYDPPNTAGDTTGGDGSPASGANKNG